MCNNIEDLVTKKNKLSFFVSLKFSFLLIYSIYYILIGIPKWLILLGFFYLVYI